MIHLKSPDAVLDWPISYTLEAGETITASSWTVAPVEVGGLSVDVGSDTISGATTACMLTGGVYGHRYRVLNNVTTSQGRTYSEHFAVLIEQTEAA